MAEPEPKRVNARHGMVGVQDLLSLFGPIHWDEAENRYVPTDGGKQHNTCASASQPGKKSGPNAPQESWRTKDRSTVTKPVESREAEISPTQIKLTVRDLAIRNQDLLAKDGDMRREDAELNVEHRERQKQRAELVAQQVELNKQLDELDEQHRHWEARRRIVNARHIDLRAEYSRSQDAYIRALEIEMAWAKAERRKVQDEVDQSDDGQQDQG